MIPYFMLSTPLSMAIGYGILIAMTGLLVTALLVFLCLATHTQQHLYTLSLPLVLPCTALSVSFPYLAYSATTPFMQGFLLLPLLIFPLSLPIRTLQPSWTATAQELGAHRIARLRFFWWPLLQKPIALTLFLSIIFSIVQ